MSALSDIPSPPAGERARVRENQRSNHCRMPKAIAARSPSPSRCCATGPSLSPGGGEGKKLTGSKSK